MKHSFIKHMLISGGVILATSGVAVFAQTNIQTNIFNAWQSIMRTSYTTNGSQNGAKLMDINDGTGIYISGTLLQNTTAVNGLGIDANGYVTTNVSLGGGQQGATGPQGPQGVTGFSVVTSGDADWYSVTSPGNAPLNINEDIYTYGQVGIGMQNPTVPLQVSGNVIFGNTGNIILGGLYSSILGGINNILNGSYATIVGGENNMSEGPFSTIVGGQSNIISGGAFDGFIGAGLTNTLENSMAGVIGGGVSNRILFNITSFIGGGQGNLIIGAMGSGKENNGIVGGFNNTIKDSNFSFIGGGHLNAITGNNNVIGGGLQNNIQATSMGRSTIAGGDSNTVNGDFSTIGGGLDNIINGSNSTIAGGIANNIVGTESFIGGGTQNIIGGSHTSIVGGYYNEIYGENSSILGGMYNTIETGSHLQTILGGGSNRASGSYGLSRGYNNRVEGGYSVAMGSNAKALHNNSFIWSDDLLNDFTSTNSNQFLIHASNGVGINTNAPQAALHVSGAMVSSQTSGINGSGISIDAQEVNSFTTTRGSDITIEGIQNGVQGQVVHIAKAHTGYSLTLDNNPMQGTDQLLVGATSPVIAQNQIGGFTLLYDGSQRIVIGRYSN